MKNFALTIALCASISVISHNSYADKMGYYRWTDNEGKQHFTQQPPLGRRYEFIETRSGASISSGGSDDFTEVREEVEEEPDAELDNVPDKMEILPPKDPALCKKAQENLRSLTANGARIRITNPDGSTRMLNAEEIKQQENRAQSIIKLHCN